ncbi:hypothetical protein B0T25DRAFT_344977 [Lasiosphaeria hispida]|uniref:Uncharacterized protein n=1 Tax=Lasiosphaeria hispida TaxID=260671 RepID=A0AAJ0H6J2_9PEZI|nr:hypothetical protein B0T25DRAFT_344977 [Lasiosphaeria hispida]
MWARSVTKPRGSFLSAARFGCVRVVHFPHAASAARNCIPRKYSTSPGQHDVPLRKQRLPRFPLESRCWSITLDPSNFSKQELANAVCKAQPKLGLDEVKGQRRNAAVILVTKGLAHLLEDQAYLQQLVMKLEPDRTSSTFSLLSAIVDGIPDEGRCDYIPGVSIPPHVLKSSSYLLSSEGIAALPGSLDSILPGLWDPAEAPPAHHGDADSAQPALEFHVRPPLGLRVTVPVANTIFTNGRPHTMFATEYKWATPNQLEQTRRVEKSKQIVIPSRFTKTKKKNKIRFPLACVPLLPLTQPRKIVSGMGNILRQIEVDGEPVPASRELEELIPKVIAARSEVYGTEKAGPMDVWALITPEAALARLPKQPPALPSGARRIHPSWMPEARAVFEQRYAQHCAIKISVPQVLEMGGQIRKVLSGGGGWGPKQGLLSLDPQTRYSTPDQEDVESFIRSFKGEGGPASGITPGSWVQFVYEPRGDPLEVKRPVQAVDPVLLGASGKFIGTESSSPDESNMFIVGTQGTYSLNCPPRQITVHHGLFGATAPQGIYVAADERSSSEISAVVSKIDMANAYLSWGKRKWKKVEKALAHVYGICIY